MYKYVIEIRVITSASYQFWYDIGMIGFAKIAFYVDDKQISIFF